LKAPAGKRLGNRSPEDGPATRSRLVGGRGTGASALGLLIALALTLSAFSALGASPALAATQRPYLSQITGLTKPVGLSVDPTDDLRVTDPGNGGLISKYSPFPANAKIGEQDGEGHFTFGGEYIVSAVLGRNAKLYVGDSGAEVVHVFKPDGEWEETWTGFSGFVHVAVDNSGTPSDSTVYVSESGGATVKAFTAAGIAQNFTESAPYIAGDELTGTPTGPGGAVEPFGSAWSTTVGTNGDLYVADQSGEAVDEFEPSGQFVTQFKGIGEIFGVAVDPTSGAVLAAEKTAVLEFTPAGALEGRTTVADGSPFTEIGGLAVDSTGHLYVSDRGAGHVDVFGPAEPLPLETDGGSVTGITDSTATLRAQITPNGHLTSYAFLYGTADCAVEPGACTQTPVALQALGDGEATLEVSLRLIGLVPGTTYHYRLLVENTDTQELLPTPDRTFTIQGAGTSTLPDGRVWEMVSPADKHGIPLESITHEGGLIQAAADGSGIAYIAKGPVDSEAGSNRTSEPQQLLATRVAPGIWSTQDLATPHQAPVGLIPGNPSEYKLFSPDLTSSIVEPAGATPLSPQTTGRTPYVREADGHFEPLVSAANVPPGTKFEGKETGPEDFSGAVEFVTATSDFSHILLSSTTSLVEGFETGGNESVYEWSGGELEPVSVLANEASASVEEGAAKVGNFDFQVRNAISADGSRVFFSTAHEGRLYMRDITLGKTVRLDAPEPGLEKGRATFQFANTVGTKAFFTDEARLTSNSSAATGKPDLYECTITVVSGEPTCSLADLSVDHNAGEAASVEGAVLGADESGRYIYFAARGALAPGAVKGTCPNVSEGTCLNLYAYDTQEDAIKLVAVLSEADDHDWFAAAEGTDLGRMTSRVSPDGRYLAFMSRRPLTGYDNRDAKTDVRDQEVYLYDDTTSKLVCVSCNPTGARPRGIFDPGEFPGLLVDRPELWKSQTLAGSIPGWTRIDLTHSIYQSRYLSNSGRLFFNAADALVPHDTNGTEDVYEYELPQGEGQPASNDCTNASSTYSTTSGGCVDLISSGTSPEESAFVDASEDGNDVFFLTAAKLSRTDTDAAYDIYDASAGGHAVEPSSVVECAGDGCQQPAVPPTDATPSSLTFSGAGNLTECPKGKVKQKGKCVKKKQKKAKKHKKGKTKNSDKKNGKDKKGKRAAGHKRGGQK
jgi:hypothetical protein